MDAAQALGEEVGEELVARSPGLGGRHTIQHLPAPVVVDAGGQQHDGVDDAAALADLKGLFPVEGVDGGRLERGGVGASVPG